MKKSYLGLATAILFTCTITPQAMASTMTGGDAASMAEADVLLDIAFAIDTSGSMVDEIAQLTTSMQSIITNLDCPDCNVWVRADFFGINQTSGSLFNETVNYITGNPSATVTNHDEDNAPAVTDLVNFYSYWGNDDSAADQDYYKAIVTIGDEGTENGYPVYQSDWDAAYTANQAAIANDFLVFSLVGTVWPAYAGDEANRNAVFSAMAIGGSGGGYDFGNTGGTFALTTSSSLEQDIEDIICTAAGGGANDPVPEPATLLLMSTALTGLAAAKRKKLFKKN